MNRLYLIVFCITVLSAHIQAQTGPAFDWVKINEETVALNGSISVEMALGQSFSLKSRVSNNGDDSPAGYNNITYSFPQLTGSSYTTYVSNGLGTDTDLLYTEYWGSGVGGDGYAEYVMVEVVDTDGWDGNDLLFDEENEFEVYVQPINYGTFDIYVRAAASNQTSWSTGWTYEPGSSQYIDCIGFYAYIISVTIVPPITQYYWSWTSNPGSIIPDDTQIEAGEAIYLNVHATDISSVDAYIYEDDILSKNSLAKELSADSIKNVINGAKDQFYTIKNIPISAGFGSVLFTLPWIADILGGPEFYFLVNNDPVHRSGNVEVVDNIPPSVPQLVSPADAATYAYTANTISFSWDPSYDGYGSGLYKYHIQVGTDIYFMNIIWQADRFSTDASHTFDPAYTYYWRVNATDNQHNTSEYSQTRSFTIDRTATRFRGNKFVNKSTKPGCPLMLEAKLEKLDIVYTDLEGEHIYFQIKIDNQWITLPDDEISTTSLITDRSLDPGAGSGGIGRIYYLVPDDSPTPKTYSIRAVYDGSTLYAPTELEATLSVLPSHSGLPELVFSHSSGISNPIPIMLVHGDGSDSEVNSHYRWQNLIDFVYSNSHSFRFFDVWVWRNDTELPIGFNGYTGNAKELSRYIYEHILNNVRYTAGTKILFIAHSRGGLVCRSFMNYNNQGDDVMGLITLGTPHHGSPFAVPDWSAMTWAYQFSTSLLSQELLNRLVNTESASMLTRFDVDRMGSLNLAWDNLDNSINGRQSIIFPGIKFSNDNTLELSTRDVNQISTSADSTVLFSELYKNQFGTLNYLNLQEGYYNKIITYAAYDNDLSDNAKGLELIGEILDQGFEHGGLDWVTNILARFHTNIVSNSSVYYANDGLVPLQSALLLDISNGTPFCILGNSENISLVGTNIAAKKKVHKHRIFSNAEGIIDHLHLLDAPLQSSYWDTLQADILSYILPTGLEIADVQIPDKFILDQNFPNPFNPITQIRVGLPKSTHFSLEIFNNTGQITSTLYQGIKAAGYHTILFDGSDMASGTYYYRITADHFQQVRKMTLLK